ncbi:hypothetical protein [Pontibacter sp. SGAir0037]|uniref:hypothetical protein n=1 Tax=Pontibacter sp. SGAir0037 TaxID=2571030 RepID=UPI0010CCB35F|nr:hypothetical protein [Pontibacter sp. SGAir0037]QCR21037.1 hypothetical protein C1N53_00755 [Pontibacter sp. SGAir0037]
MSARSFELLLESAYDPEQPDVFPDGAAAAYKNFEQAFKQQRGRASEEVNYSFEIVRLGVAIAFVKAFTRLAHNENTKEVLGLLKEALQAKNTKEIDKIVQKKIALFDNLYHEIFVNEQREQILSLFEQTLDASSKEELDELMLEGLELLQVIDFDANNDEGDDDEPLDEDFIKSIK